MKSEKNTFDIVGRLIQLTEESCGEKNLNIEKKLVAQACRINGFRLKHLVIIN